MKKKEFAMIGKQLLKGLPGFEVKGAWLFMRPIGHILRAICFSGSIDPRSFYVHVFVQPMFIPEKHVWFNLGFRLRNGAAGEGWNADDPNLITKLSAGLELDGVVFLERMQLPQDLVNLAQARYPLVIPKGPNAGVKSSRNPIIEQLIAYCYARERKINEAVESLDQLPSLLVEFPDPPMVAQAEYLKSLLLNDPDAAQKQLDAWENETLRNLGLEEYR